MGMEGGQIVPCQGCPARVRSSYVVQPGETSIMQLDNGFRVVSRSQGSTEIDGITIQEENLIDTSIESSPLRYDISECPGAVQNPGDFQEHPSFRTLLKYYNLAREKLGISRVPEKKWPRVLQFLNFTTYEETKTCPATKTTKITLITDNPQKWGVT